MQWQKEAQYNQRKIKVWLLFLALFISSREIVACGPFGEPCD